MALAAVLIAFSFGRTGGNIIPFTVTIATSGRVQVSGPVQVDKHTLTQAQLAGLNRIAAQVRFSSLQGAMCPRTLPDVASTFIKKGPHTVRVHGTCVAAYQRLWAALTAAVRLRY
ncbi:MAG TPA: hypothetical protein VKP14_05020 [Gaiellaceae bacterium]|nr:hypothetical protein [Gaiellaceae bacterium]